MPVSQHLLSSRSLTLSGKHRVSLACAVLLGAGSGSIRADAPLPAASPAPLVYKDTWVGNSSGRGDGKWVQNNILGLYVAPEGTVYTNSWWDEGRRESGIYSGTEGDPVGMLESMHDSFGGGFAVAGDEEYIYVSNWDAVRRCRPDGKRAPFAGGHGVNGDSIGVSTKPTGKDKGIGVQGLAVDRANHRLYVSQNNDNEMQVWNTAEMTLVGKWPVVRPGHIAVAPDGTIWMISRKDASNSAQIIHFAANGNRLPQTITGGTNFDPTGICYGTAGNFLLVADNGPEQNVKVYASLNISRTSPDAIFGASVFSGVPGQITEAKFGTSGLTAVGTDAAGNIYVAMNGVGPQSYWHGGGTVLESWTPAGKLRWRKLGLAFVDCADADPASDHGDILDIYDKYSHYRLDLAKTDAGSEWSYVGHTLNQIKYPGDQRFVRAADGWDYTGGTFVRNIKGRKLLFVLSMQGRRMLIYRFQASTDGEVAVPAGIWESNYGYQAGYPGAPAGKDFLWRDKNGNGGFDADEFEKGPGMPNLGFGMWVDSEGDLWSSNHWAQSGVGIRRWKLQGFDFHGNPIYDYARDHYTEYQRPANCHGEIRRVEYYPENDTMYVASTSAVNGDRDAGTRVVKYEHWSKPDRSIAWTLDPPLDNTRISALSVAGDYLFLGYSYFGTNSQEGTIRVYKTSDASFAGVITPAAGVGGVSGTFDIPYAIRAVRRHDGEYLIFAEDDNFAKVVVHRWTPERQIP